MEPVIFIAVEGNKTYALGALADGSIGKGYAECREGDSHSVVVGAIIALCKALGAGPTNAALDVLRAYAVDAKGAQAAAKVRVQVVKRPDPNAPRVGEVIGLISSPAGRVELSVSKELKDYGLRGMGVVGKRTKFTDYRGKRLHVGDLVTIESLVGTTRSGKRWTPFSGLHFVVDEDSDDKSLRGAYIMGLCGGCNPKTGEIDHDFRVRLAKKWYEVELGETHDAVRTVWKEKAN